MSKKLIKIILAAVAALLVIQLLRVQLKEQPGTPESEGMSRIRIGNIEGKTVRKKYRYTGKMEGIRQVMLYPPVPGILKEKTSLSGSRVEKDGTVLLVDRYEEGLEYEYSRVRSPIAGTVMEIMPDIGERVLPSQPVAIVADTSNMKATLHVPEEEAAVMEEGQEVFLRVKSLEDKIFSGTVTEVQPALDRKTMRRKIRIRVQNSRGLLRPSMICEADVVVKKVEAEKAVPLISIVRRENREGIFIVDEDSYARWKPVEIILRGNEYAAVEGDFKEEEKVAVEGHFGLVPGRKVEIIN